MNAAFIPVRGGSKSIPLKNIKPIIDKVYVATGSNEIRETKESFRFPKQK